MEPIENPEGREGKEEKEGREEEIETETYAKEVQASAVSAENKNKEEKTSERKIELPKVNLPKIDVSKFNLRSVSNWTKNKLGEYARVLKITKKPDKTEFQAIVRASGLGIAVIGTIGFIIHMIVQGIQLVK